MNTLSSLQPHKLSILSLPTVPYHYLLDELIFTYSSVHPFIGPIFNTPIRSNDILVPTSFYIPSKLNFDQITQTIIDYIPEIS